MSRRGKRQQSKIGLPLPVWIAGLVGLALIAAGLAVLTEQQGSNPNSTSLPFPAVPRISPSEAHNQQQTDRGIIIDVREAQFYQESHARGAFSYPESELLARIGELPTDKMLILY